MLSKYLEEENIVTAENLKIYEYGKNQTILLIKNIATSLLIGVLMGMVMPSIIFSLSYILLRSNAGGYHAKNQKWCYICSIFMVALALITVNYIYLYPRICIYVLAISTIIIMKLAPIEAKSKPLDKMEVIVYRRRTITTLWILVLIALLLLFLDLQLYLASIVVAIACVSIILILGKYLTAE